jgi:hypothetical protein
VGSGPSDPEISPTSLPDDGDLFDAMTVMVVVVVVVA